MKVRSIIVIFIAVFVVTMACYAQNAQQKGIIPSAQPLRHRPLQTKLCVGTVEASSLADPAKGTKSEIIVSEGKEKKTTVLVMSTTTIYDKHAHPITLEKINKNEYVRVKYTVTKEGVNEAVSIHVQP